MDREQFLRAEHARIVQSGEFVAVEWRDNVDRFIADLWDIATFNKAGRYLAPKVKTLGFTRDNVEYHFHGPARSVTLAKAKNMAHRNGSPKKANASSAEAVQRRVAETAGRLERRQKLAEQALAWERRTRRG